MSSGVNNISSIVQPNHRILNTETSVFLSTVKLVSKIEFMFLKKKHEGKLVEVYLGELSPWGISSVNSKIGVRCIVLHYKQKS
jgi:hypothetical protein